MMDPYLQQLYQHSQRQQKEIEFLKSSVQSLVNELQALREKPAITVERLEYKFDQLKVETLEGTLNIGLNPADLGSLEELSVPITANQSTNFNKQPLLNSLTQNIDQAFDTIVKKTEDQVGFRIDKSYHELMKQDILKQLPQRIDFYYQQFRSQNAEEIPETQLHEHIFNAVMNDIERGVHTFVTQLPKNLRRNGTTNGEEDNT